jgi:choline dehydrogenase-like flavoprotein
MSTETTRCAVVGGGPGGVVLAYLLARAGVPVTLLESRPDFDRRFRGDALAPPVLDVLDHLGLADPLLAAVPHGTAQAFVWRTPTRAYRLADYRRASARYPYYALVPQGRFLPFMVQEAVRFPGFRVEMGAAGVRAAARRRRPRRRRRVRPWRSPAAAARGPGRRRRRAQLENPDSLGRSPPPTSVGGAVHRLRTADPRPPRAAISGGADPRRSAPPG